MIGGKKIFETKNALFSYCEKLRKNTSMEKLRNKIRNI